MLGYATQSKFPPKQPLNQKETAMKTANVKPKPTRNGYVKISRDDFFTIGGFANNGAFTTDAGCFVEVDRQAHKEYLKLLNDRKNYSRF